MKFPFKSYGPELCNLNEYNGPREFLFINWRLGPTSHIPEQQLYLSSYLFDKLLPTAANFYFVNLTEDLTIK